MAEASPADLPAAAEAQLDPSSVLDAERFLDYERSVVRTPLFERTLAALDRPGLEVCDVGGASGVFLTALEKESPHPFHGTVLEVDPAYRDRQINPRMGFLEASILDNDLPDASFDLMTFRHILHHLVGDSVAACRALQRKAVSELLRLTRPGGQVIFQEQTNEVRRFSSAVYHLSRFANRYRLRWRYFETGTVVISFLTSAELAALVRGLQDQRGDFQIEAESYAPRRVDLRWKLTLLMSRLGDAVYVLRKDPA